MLPPKSSRSSRKIKAPVIPMIPETEYLKGFAFEKVR